MGLSRNHMLALACAGSIFMSLPAFAALTGSDIVNAIRKAEFLDESTQLNARVDGDKVLVSTFRNPHSNVNDLKIDAILIAKSILDMTSAVSRVTTYFYGGDLSEYQEVSVTAGDVKAFASGDVGKDQLLSGIQITTKKQESNSDKVAKQLQATYFAKPDFKVAVQQGTMVEINTPMAPWVSDEQCKLDALTIATNATSALPEGIRQLKIKMVDPGGRADSRNFTFNVSEVKDLWRQVQQSLSGLAMAREAPTVDLASLKVVDGPEKEGREKLLSQLRELSKAGVGIAPFVQAFLSVEKMAKANDPGVADAVKRLDANLADQVKAMAAAKEKRGGPTKAASAAPAGPDLRRSRWNAGGGTGAALIPSDVLQNPQNAVNAIAGRMSKPDEDPNFLVTLTQAARILREAGRGGEAAPFEQRAAAMRAKGIR